MALTTAPGSSSPQWDSRHRGFISPAELQQLRQASPGRGTDLHEFQARHPTGNPNSNPSTGETFITTTEDTLASPRPAPAPQQATMSHIRTSSFFSFRKQVQSSDMHDNPHSASSKSPSNVAPDRDFAPSPPQHNQQRAQTMGPLRSSSDKKDGSGQSQSDPSPAVRRISITAPPLHPEIRSIVQLTLTHARKVYFSGPLVKHVQRQPDGQRPKEDAWTDVWAQLGGTTLSIWDMKEVEEANKQGREVPPTYVNMTDAFVQVLGSVTIPESQDRPRKTYLNVLTLNTAGSNLILFSCPSTVALVSWATALRLSAWEKSRLEEIYTAHLIRITLNDGKDARTTLVRGRMEGWVRIRVAGQTDWKRMWMVVSSAQPPSNDSGTPTTTGSGAPPKKRMSNIFSREHSPEPLPTSPLLALYAGPRPKEKKHPLLTLKEMSQAFAVYPERPELISRSSLMKLEGLIGDEDTAGGMKRKEGWLLVMPELEPGNTQASEMLKWLIAIHDAFELYGRPKAYTWDPRDPTSMMFAYPIGPGRDLLFLDRDVAESMDPRDDRTSIIRSRLINILHERMRLPNPHATEPPSSPSIPVGFEATSPPKQQQQQQQPQNINEPKPEAQNRQSGQFPAIDFDSSSPPDLTVGRGLSPITERNTTRETLPDCAPSHGHSMSGEHHTPESMMISRSMSSERPDSGQSMSSERQNSMSFSEHSQSQLLPQRVPLNPVPEGASMTGTMTDIPQAGSPPPTMSSRSESKLTPSLETTRSRSTEATHASASVDMSGFRHPLTPESPASPAFSSTSTSPSTGMGRPISPGMSLSSFVAPVPLRPSASRTPPPTRPITGLPSPYSPKGKEKELPSIQDVQDTVQLPARALSSPPSTTLPSRGGLSPPLPPKAIPSTSQSNIPVSTVTVPVIPSQQDSQSIFSDALLYMQQLGDKPKNPPRRVPTTISERSSSGSDEGSASHKPLHAPLPQPARRAAPFSELGTEANISEHTMIGSRPPLGRKPSGARVQPTPSRGPNVEATSFISSPSPERLHTSGQAMEDPQKSVKKRASGDDVNVDALAALSFLAAEPETPAPPTSAPQPPPPREVSPELAVEGSAASESSEGVMPYRSSFAPSKQQAQRKARAEAQQQAVLHKPGRANGKRMSSGNRLTGWNESSDEEEEEEEEEDDEDADSDDEPPSATESKKPTPAPPAPVAPTRPLRPTSAGRVMTPVEHVADANSFSQSRRNLPPVPTQDEYVSPAPVPRRIVSDQHMRTPDDAPHLRPQSEYPSQIVRPHTEHNPHAAARHSIWTQVLDPGRAPGSLPQAEAPTHQRDTFIQLEPASHSMTKAFTPHGLLSAGMQDKQDRSAKRQEELARETGGSLINVPTKPPPPQTGLLGAITAHERERKREGGVGAALTEREREKRLAEERQRKIDEFQRQQLDMQSMYGQQQFPNMMNNPMMPNPMMMAMNPMMTGTPMMANPNPMMTGMAGGYMGFPNMMPGFGNPQFYAQQAAQAAYQQAMMAAYSSGGSHVADGITSTPMNPMMTGGGMGFDPRMSMMGMPMMATPMGMNGMGGGMGMGMGGGGMGGMGMQMTGGSTFDARFSPANIEDLRPPAAPGQVQRTGHNSSRNSSAGQGSPAGPRPIDSRDSPKH